MKKILNLLYPPSCYSCKVTTINAGLCSKCYSKILFAMNNYCNKCGFYYKNIEFKGLCANCVNKQYHFDSIDYCVVYNDMVYSLINQFKNHDSLHLKVLLSDFLIDKIRREVNLQQVDIIIPVPIHYFKLFLRQYNHMSIIGNYIAKQLHMETNNLALYKTRYTKMQKLLKLSMRLQNLKKSFSCNNKYRKSIENKTILLIDDVITTGSTVNECAKVLKKYGAKEVKVLSFARVDGILKCV
jgi:competence protein ComFC